MISVFRYIFLAIFCVAIPIATAIGMAFLSHYGYFPVISWGRGAAQTFLFSGYCLLLLCVGLIFCVVLWFVKKMFPRFRYWWQVSVLSLLLFVSANIYVFSYSKFSPLFLNDPIIGFVDARKRGDDNNLGDEEKFGHRLRDYTLEKIAQRFEISDQGYVLDKHQKLMWQRCALGQVWQSGACVGDTETMEFTLAHRAATAR